MVIRLVRPSSGFRLKAFFFCALFAFGLCSKGFGSFKIVFLGDSLTEGFGVDGGEAFPALVLERFEADRIADVEIVNAGFSGSTSAGAPARMKWILKSEPDLVFLALGANDGLRGLSIASVRRNLTAAIEIARQAGVKVVLAGMQIPPNYGAEYTSSFRRVFYEVAEAAGVELVPFLLEGVAAVPELNLPDGIHPNPDGHVVISGVVYPYLRKAYDSAGR